MLFAVRGTTGFCQLAEGIGPATIFVQTLGLSTNGFPNTRRLLHVGNLVGGFAVMYYKDKFKRVRPSQLCPALLPPIAVPGHASFPSGHSTQAHLAAACVKLALPKNNTLKTLSQALDVLAHRIARNREIGGLHYPSDSAAGKELADFALNLLMKDLPPAPGERVKSRFTLTVEAAVKEWA